MAQCAATKVTMDMVTNMVSICYHPIMNMVIIITMTTAEEEVRVVAVNHDTMEMDTIQILTTHRGNPYAYIFDTNLFGLSDAACANIAVCTAWNL